MKNQARRRGVMVRQHNEGTACIRVANLCDHIVGSAAAHRYTPGEKPVARNVIDYTES
jgi:hypothetical protein